MAVMSPVCTCRPEMESAREALQFAKLALGCTTTASVFILFACVLLNSCLELSTVILEGKPENDSVYLAGFLSTVLMMFFFGAYLKLKVLLHNLYQYQTRSWPTMSAALKLMNIIVAGLAVFGLLFVFYLLIFAMASVSYGEAVESKVNIPNRVFQSAVVSTVLTSVMYMGYRNIVDSLHALRNSDFISMFTVTFTKRPTAQALAAFNSSFLTMVTVFFLLYTFLHSLITFSSVNLHRALISKVDPIRLLEITLVPSLLTIFTFTLYESWFEEPRQPERTQIMLLNLRGRCSQSKDLKTRSATCVVFYENEVSNRTARAPAKNGANSEGTGVRVLKVTVEVWSPKNPTVPNDISPPPMAQDETADVDVDLKTEEENSVRCA